MEEKVACWRGGGATQPREGTAGVCTLMAGASETARKEAGPRSLQDSVYMARAGGAHRHTGSGLLGSRAGGRQAGSDR